MQGHEFKPHFGSGNYFKKKKKDNYKVSLLLYFHAAQWMFEIIMAAHQMFPLHLEYHVGTALCVIIKNNITCPGYSLAPSGTAASPG